MKQTIEIADEVFAEKPWRRGDTWQIRGAAWEFAKGAQFELRFKKLPNACLGVREIKNFQLNSLTELF